jgi:glycosyltransferase involved in cell wall biosynthesis
MITLSVIVPAYNEEKRLPETLKKVREYLNKQKYTSEVIVVDDGSKDKTHDIAEDLVKDWEGFKVVSYTPNRGKGFAVKTGMLAARGQWRLLMDADNSTDISEIEKLLKYKEDFEVIIGSRYLNKDSIKIKQPLSRRIVSRLGNILVRLVLGIKSGDTQCGFKLFSATVADKIFPLQAIDRWGFDMEILTIAIRHGYKIKEVAVDWYDAEGSQVKKTTALKTLKELFIIKWNVILGKYSR